MTGKSPSDRQHETAQDSPRRLTRQRRAILTVLARSERFLTAQEIHANLRKTGVHIGLTTVYRTLRAMARDSFVDTLVTGAGEMCYRTCSAPATHHHLICRRCRRTVELDNPEIRAWAEGAASRHGYADLAPVVAQIFGVCDRCTA